MKQGTIQLEHNNPDVGSTIRIWETENDYRVSLKDCDESITWRFRHTSKDRIVDSLLKAERAIVKLQELQDLLKAKLND